MLDMLTGLKNRIVSAAQAIAKKLEPVTRPSKAAFAESTVSLGHSGNAAKANVQALKSTYLAIKNSVLVAYHVVMGCIHNAQGLKARLYDNNATQSATLVKNARKEFNLAQDAFDASIEHTAEVKASVVKSWHESVEAYSHAKTATNHSMEAISNGTALGAEGIQYCYNSMPAMSLPKMDAFASLSRVLPVAAA